MLRPYAHKTDYSSNGIYAVLHPANFLGRGLGVGRIAVRYKI